jgi:vanillate O-demethylase ferredoxin subunit
MNDAVFDVLVRATTLEARGVLSFDLRGPDGADLPAFTAGSHIDVYLPNGLIRNYSLVNSPAETHRYVISVSRDANTTGGSKYLFEHQLVGQTLKISTPRNNFSLVENAKHVVLIAGGIGITPLHSMILHLEETGGSWELHYGTRDRMSAAFREDFEIIESNHPGRIHFNFDDEQGQMLDVGQVVAAAPEDAHLYCCGPLPMLEAFKAATANHPTETVHIEYFTAPTVPAAQATPRKSFTVVLSSTGQSFEVGPTDSILGVLFENGIRAAYSCTEGMCGSCVVGVLEGEPDHKDFVLSDKEHAANNLMTICVSGSLSEKLVIDL